MLKIQILRTIYSKTKRPTILAIQNKCKNRIKFAFEEIDLASIEKEIYNLKINKPPQSLDIPTKIKKKNGNTFAAFLWKRINISSKFAPFVSCLKSADLTPFHKKGEKDKKKVATDL